LRIFTDVVDDDLNQNNADEESKASNSDDEESADEAETESLADQCPLDESLLDAQKSSGACSDSGDSENPKNSKKRFTPFQVETLKRVFEETPYITQSQAATIARQTGLKKLQVRKWFSDYRCKIKRLSAGLEQPAVVVNESQAEDKKLLSKERVPKKRILARFETDQQQQLPAPPPLQVAPVNNSSPPLDDCSEPSPRANKSPAYGKRTRRKAKKRDPEYGPTTKRNKKSVIIDYTESKQVKRFTPYQVETLKKTYSEHPI